MEKTKWLRLYMNCKICHKLYIYKYRTICEHCKEECYCSSECCFKDKISHRKDCKGLSLADSKTLTKGPNFSKVNSSKKWLNQKVVPTLEAFFVFCLRCNKKRAHNQTLFCHKCRGVFYCSQACLDKDAPNHSLKCETSSLFLNVQDGLYHGQTFQILKKKGISDSMNTSLFIDSTHNEFCSEVLGLAPERSVLILQIVGPYPQSRQFAILTRDLQGKTVHLIFSHDETTKASMTGGPNLEPYSVAMVPLADCLKPGIFIILLDPLLHVFKDLTQGIHIDSLEKVHCVWKD